MKNMKMVFLTTLMVSTAISSFASDKVSSPASNGLSMYKFEEQTQSFERSQAGQNFGELAKRKCDKQCRRIKREKRRASHGNFWNC